MTAVAPRADLQARGIHLELVGDQLRCQADAGILIPDLVAIIKANKPALIAALLEEETAIAWRVEAMRAQVPTAGPVPFLVAVPGVPSSPNTCLSCGDPFTPVGYTPRCHLCTLAAQQALAPMPDVIAQSAPAAAA